MSPQDRYQVCGSVSGLIETVGTKAEAFRIGEKVRLDDRPVEVFDCFAHHGKPECWRYDDDSHSWRVVAIRGG